ncbi:class I SAM-dependent methyltransferase [Roseofilum sp. BLCC_M154]|uniref:Class I SAM-dependent methyltransferase n=1 Tax=Roseofilum acuticapitatum BLCC-M154 TaxID=3022444 RepID=A0ABT7ATV6_9CYAN|nr:class I SAM-dependent methyltransferase [Roseofilum acuticapitatum]MDJ1170324.1 class I SAM-dependent methyltransferase [Roseofilum acuticapitatum BLCC-M154]
MMPNDLYKGMSTFYNAFVQRNRDYKAIATDLIDLFGNAKTILDVGIGTGLLVEQILQLRPDLDIVGIDTSSSLLTQAKQCLGSKVTLYCEDISNLHLNQMFDLAYSRGGAWAFVNDGDTLWLASHILDLKTIEQSFARVAAHLCDQGRLIIISSNANHTKSEQADNEMLFERTVTKELIEDRQYLILNYQGYHLGNLVGEQQIRMRLIDLEYVEKILDSVGLRSISDHNGEYHIYQKRSFQ